jgi:hypothetical protein
MGIAARRQKVYGRRAVITRPTTPAPAYRVCLLKYQKLVPYPSTAEMEPAERIITRPITVRRAVGARRRVRFRRATAAAVGACRIRSSARTRRR